jgi:hypothetical protein
MATFLSTQNMRVQEHFEVLEIDLPIISGTCTIGTEQGTGTPLTCDQKWAIADGGQSEYKTYYFTNENAPLLPSINGEPIWRCIKSINETATELKPGEGLSGRSSLSVVLADFTNQDPNADNIPTGVKEQGTYLGKLDARQIFENKAARLKLYRVQEDGSVDLVNGAQTRSYLTNTMSLNPDGTWSFRFKDLLSLVNLGEKSWPITKGGFIQLDIDDSQNTITVDDVVTYTVLSFIRIGDEFFKIVSINSATPSSPVLTVTPRGADLLAPTSGALLTTTSATTHSAGDEVFICDLSDNETIDGLLTRVLVESDFPSALIPAADWAAEVLEWHSTDRINTLHSESEDVNSVINRIITGYLMNLWFDPIGTATYPSGQARLSAISVWKQSTASLTEGKEINAYTIKKVAKEQLRATRALILYDKRNLAESNDTANFKKGSQFSDNTLIGPELFTKHKDKIFEANSIIDKDAADLVTQRYVSQYKFPPYERTFITDERHLMFKTGDVVDLLTSADQSPYGLMSGNIRGQITKINPSYQGGRKYSVKALTYEAAFTTGSEIVLDSPLSSVNLFVQAGAPSSSVNLTFILDGTYSHGNLSIISGAFQSGTTLNIILANGFDGQATGGRGGAGEGIEFDTESGSIFYTAATNGQGAGVVFTGSTGITINIYFSGDTSAISTAYPVANGYIRAPSGGAGGFDHTGSGSGTTSGNGGVGGAGRSPGIGGGAGSVTGGSGNSGTAGANGSIAGPSWGVAGANNDKTGGAAGSGIINNGATINLFGDTPARYINGNGSHP